MKNRISRNLKGMIIGLWTIVGISLLLDQFQSENLNDGPGEPKVVLDANGLGEICKWDGVFEPIRNTEKNNKRVNIHSFPLLFTFL